MIETLYLYYKLLQLMAKSKMTWQDLYLALGRIAIANFISYNKF